MLLRLAQVKKKKIATLDGFTSSFFSLSHVYGLVLRSLFTRILSL